MRPVEKGVAPTTYKNYQDARDDLIERIGRYCAYCEMRVNSQIEVEHVVPTTNGGSELEWENFLLSCKTCNTCKWNKNLSREGYYWPDKDNTFRIFCYGDDHLVRIYSELNSNEKNIAQATLDLLNLNRKQDSRKREDERITSRRDAWGKAHRSLDYWKTQRTTEKAISDTATATGHFSIWMEVFKDELTIRQALISEFKGTRRDCIEQ